MCRLAHAQSVPALHRAPLASVRGLMCLVLHECSLASLPQKQGQHRSQAYVAQPLHPVAFAHVPVLLAALLIGLFHFVGVSAVVRKREQKSAAEGNLPPSEYSDFSLRTPLLIYVVLIESRQYNSRLLPTIG